MTREMTDSELDVEIASKIMGVRCWKEKRGDYTACVRNLIDGREPWKYSRGDQSERYTEVSCAEAQEIGFFGTGIDPYSSSIAHAWLVVEEVQRTHPGLRFVLLGGDASFGKEWKAEFFGDLDPQKCTGERHGEAFASTPARAICEAALAALESECAK